MDVGLLGNSGRIAEKYKELLKDHPWFRLSFIASRKGPHYLGELPSCKLLFSALPGEVAGEWEPFYAKEGYTVISSSSFFRLDPTVPLIIPELNRHHLNLLKNQQWKGALIAKPNCSIQSYLLPLGFLHPHFGIEKIHVTTMQAISGAREQKDPNFVDNIIPYIEHEEDKCEEEPNKILESTINISAQCHRVSVQNGHLASLSVSFQTKPKKEEILQIWKEANPLKLPSSPNPLFHYHEDQTKPQPRFDLHPMQIQIGRLRPCSILDWRFVALSHNTIRGGAGNGLLIAEVLYG